MTFIREDLPDTRTYFEGKGLTKTGRGKWITTSCTFHGGQTFFARLKSPYSRIKDVVSVFYIHRGIGLESIAMLILVAVVAVMRAYQ